jgi:hypothetical protein
MAIDHRTLAFDNANKYTIAPGTGGTLTQMMPIGPDLRCYRQYEISPLLTVASTASVDVDNAHAECVGWILNCRREIDEQKRRRPLRISGPQSHGVGRIPDAMQARCNWIPMPARLIRRPDRTGR